MISWEDRTARVSQLFGMSDDMTTAEMNAVINEIIASYKATVENIKSQLANAFEEYSVDGVLTKAQMRKYGRLLAMEEQMASQIKNLTGEMISKTRASIRNTFESNYYRTGSILENGYGMDFGLPMMNPDALTANIQNPLSLIKWSDAEKVWSNKYILDIRNHINSGLNQGWGYSKIANNITHSGIISRKRAMRIVHTETHRAQQVARSLSMEDAKASAKRLGIKMEKFWLSELLPTTRDVHSALDGTIADEHGIFHMHGMTVEYPGGFGIASQDINCHCSIEQRIPKLDKEYTRRLKNLDESGYEDFKYKDLKDWKRIKANRLKEIEEL